MARFTVTETTETTYEVNVDDGDYAYIEAWRRGDVTTDEFHEFLQAGALDDIEFAVTDRDIEET